MGMSEIVGFYPKLVPPCKFCTAPNPTLVTILARGVDFPLKRTFVERYKSVIGGNPIKPVLLYNRIDRHDFAVAGAYWTACGLLSPVVAVA